MGALLFVVLVLVFGGGLPCALAYRAAKKCGANPALWFSGVLFPSVVCALVTHIVFPLAALPPVTPQQRESFAVYQAVLPILLACATAWVIYFTMVIFHRCKRC